MKRTPTPQHVTWILDLHNNGQLDLNPPYQRKSVWTSKDRKFFMDTIFRNYPTPPVFLHRELDDNGHATYHVVDGKQRLETIINFANSKIAIAENFGNEKLNGKKFKNLEIEEKRIFWDYVLVVDFIENIEGTNIEEVFDRVNRNSKNLQPQELRHARFDGWFIKEAESEAVEDFWWNIKVSTKGKQTRMKNVQLISELLFIILDGKIVGFNQDYIDEMYAKFDSIEEDEDYSFDLDEYRDKKVRAKRIIEAMNDHNNCINDYCKTANNLYTLWSLIVLNLNESYTDYKTLAVNYSDFMQIIDRTEIDELKSPYKTYAENSIGASTDLTQRQARLEALKIILV